MCLRASSSGVSRADQLGRPFVLADAQTRLALAPARPWERRRLMSAMANGLVTLSALGAVLVLLLILGHVIVQGIPALNPAFFTERPLPAGEVGGGVAPAIVGTLEMLAVAGLMGIPIGVGTAIYLAEFGQGNLARIVSFTI